MPYVSALENILKGINIGVNDYLGMSSYVFREQDSKKESFRRYTPDSIDRKLLPHMDINSISYIRDQHLDVVLQGMFQNYSMALQESRERALLDDSFDRTSLDKKLDVAMNRRYGMGVFLFLGAVSTVATLGLAKIMNPNYPGMPPMAGSVVGAFLVLIEHWGNPIGKLLMSTYTNSETLGTRYYEDKIKHTHLKEIRKYAKKYAPQLLIEELGGEYNFSKKPAPVVSKEKVLDANVFSN